MHHAPGVHLDKMAEDDVKWGNFKINFEPYLSPASQPQGKKPAKRRVVVSDLGALRAELDGFVESQRRLALRVRVVRRPIPRSEVQPRPGLNVDHRPRLRAQLPAGSDDHPVPIRS